MRRQRDRVPTLVALAAVLALALLPGAAPASAQSARCGPSSATSRPGTADEEARLVALSNATRKERGLAPLAVHRDLAAKARAWSAKMAREGVISHSDLSVGVTSTAPASGENVGCDTSVDRQHRAFVASPVHYRNLVEPAFTHVGVGFARAADGMLYTTEVFMRSHGDAPAPVVGPPPPPSAAPRAAAGPARPVPASASTGGRAAPAGDGRRPPASARAAAANTTPGPGGPGASPVDPDSRVTVVGGQVSPLDGSGEAVEPEERAVALVRRLVLEILAYFAPFGDALR